MSSEYIIELLTLFYIYYILESFIKNILAQCKIKKWPELESRDLDTSPGHRAAQLSVFKQSHGTGQGKDATHILRVWCLPAINMKATWQGALHM